MLSYLDQKRPFPFAPLLPGCDFPAFQGFSRVFKGFKEINFRTFWSLEIRISSRRAVAPRSGSDFRIRPSRFISAFRFLLSALSPAICYACYGSVTPLLPLQPQDHPMFSMVVTVLRLRCTIYPLPPLVLHLPAAALKPAQTC